MSNFSSLKTAIQNAIKANGNQEITGNLLQGILLSIVETLGDSAINTLETGLRSEASTRSNADTTLQTNINNEVTARQNADTQLNNLITGIKNNIDNGYVYAGIATPSAAPVNGKVFYIALQAGTYTNFGGQVVLRGITILKYNGSAWSKEQVLYTDGGVFDISAYHAIGGTLATYAKLEAALDSNNGGGVPQSLQEGGMSVKFVRTSDNKYVQYRLMSDEFTTDTTQWAIAEEGVYVENSEFVYVKTDAEGKILWAIKADGDIYYGAGCPQQVKDYIEDKISSLSLDEYEDIVAFLSDYLGSDTTLKVMIDGINAQIAAKVDKVEGKSLINAEYASSQSAIDNPEFLKVITDSEDKVLEGIKQDGTKIIGADLEVGDNTTIGGDTKILGNMEVSGVLYKIIENPEYLAAWVDAEDKIIFGLKADGKTYVGDADFLNNIKDNQEAINEIKSYLANFDNLDIDALSSITAVENPELIEAKTDSEGKILSGRTPDGAAFENVGFSAPKMSIDGYTIENIEDPESRTEILTDTEGKIISYRDGNGVKHEDVGIATNHIELSPNATQDLINALDALGYTANNPSDWSDSEFVEIPIPEVCAVINIEVDSQASAKGLDIPTYIQFWDKSGNYFRKPVLLNAQGSSSMNYHIKNQAIDLNDGSEIKFGNWPAFDSFHIKKYYIDVFRGQCNVGYWLTEQMYQSRPYGERRPWDYLNSFDDVDNASGSFSKDYDTGAMAHPDGFPVHVFFNGNDAGIYAFNIKKARGNYNMKKNKQKQIILDGILGTTFFTANGDMTISGEVDNNQSLWHDFEIRNPKIDKDIDGNKYNGDNPKEPSDAFATTKAAIARLTTAIPLTLAESTDEAKKAKFAEFFNIPFLLDYELIGQIIFNYDGYRKNWIWCTWDGNLWCPTSYDMDSIFGQHWNGASYVTGSTTQILGTSNSIPTGEALLKSLYQSELRTRYKELRDKGIFSVDNIVGLLEKWVNSCGYDNLKTDIEDIVTSPYTENGVTVVDGEGNPVLIPNTPSYRDGTKTYQYPPATGGWYNSVLRVKNWLVQRIQALDTYYNYN